MRFISADYWQQGENASSLLLQQCRQGETEVIFACVAEGETEEAGRAGGYLTGQLLKWFRRIPMRRAVRNPEQFLRKEAAQLEKCLVQINNDFMHLRLPQVEYAGIFCLGRDFLIFGRDRTSAYLLNRCMGKACAEKLLKTEKLSETESFSEAGSSAKAGKSSETKNSLRTGNDSGKEKIQIRQGIMENEVGLLLATETFVHSIPEKEWKASLFVEEILTERQVEKHLSELGSAGERNGGRHMAAILFYAK